MLSVSYTVSALMGKTDLSVRPLLAILVVRVCANDEQACGGEALRLGVRSNVMRTDRYQHRLYTWSEKQYMWISSGKFAARIRKDPG